MNKGIMSLTMAVAMLAVANCKEKPAAAPAAANAASVKWNCDFKGTNKDTKGETTKFDWKVLWTETGSNSTIVGNSADADGQSNANGTCEGTQCKIREEYTSGNLKGKVYNWTFTYEDAETKSESVYVTTIKGTYASDKDTTDTGTLAAKADCKAAQ